MPTNDRYTEEPFYKDATVKDLPLKDMTEFRLMDDPDGVHIQPWGESVKPQSHCKVIYVHTQPIQFADSEEYHFGYSQFVIPETFAEDLETNKIHYITLIKNGEETGVKYRLTKID